MLIVTPIRPISAIKSQTRRTDRSFHAMVEGFTRKAYVQQNPQTKF